MSKLARTAAAGVLVACFVVLIAEGGAGAELNKGKGGTWEAVLVETTSHAKAKLCAKLRKDGWTVEAEEKARRVKKTWEVQLDIGLKGKGGMHKALKKVKNTPGCHGAPVPPPGPGGAVFVKFAEHEEGK